MTSSLADRATALLQLHRHPRLLTLVNVWDAVSARVVAAVPGTAALATASHSIAATLGYEDGEQIPVDEMLDMCRRIVEAVEMPVSADLEGGYGDAPETVRRAIGVGVVGANIEDQLKPLSEAAGQVEAVVAAAGKEGLPDFVLNARTDVFLRGEGRDPHELLAEAVARGRAFLDAGAAVVFVPGRLDEVEVSTLAEALGPQRLSLIAVPGSLPLARMEELGVARVSFGPNSQRVALTALQDLVADALRGEGVPRSMQVLT
jgi:2-methylisocitrate lyase-like PEP mutase family enzyme